MKSLWIPKEKNVSSLLEISIHRRYRYFASTKPQYWPTFISAGVTPYQLQRDIFWFDISRWSKCLNCTNNCPAIIGGSNFTKYQRDALPKIAKQRKAIRDYTHRVQAVGINSYSAGVLPLTRFDPQTNVVERSVCAYCFLWLACR